MVLRQLLTVHNSITADISSDVVPPDQAKDLNSMLTATFNEPFVTLHIKCYATALPTPHQIPPFRHRERSFASPSLSLT